MHGTCTFAQLTCSCRVRLLSVGALFSFSRNEMDNEQAGRSSAAQVTSGAQAKSPDPTFVRFNTEDDLMLLRVVVAQNRPFARGSDSWERICSTIKAVSPKFRDASPRTFRDRARKLVLAHRRKDNVHKKQ